jgi:hypothetical protein
MSLDVTDKPLANLKGLLSSGKYAEDCYIYIKRHGELFSNSKHLLKG